MFKKLGFIVAAVLLVFSSVQSADAELSAFGPIHPVNGFPVWYQDTNGLTLELGLDPVLNLFDPPIPGNAFSELIGFGSEGFYWIAEANLDLDATNSAFYEAALEYAFANEDPVDGDQFVFVRLRFRIDAPVAGRYIVTHPYGVDVFDVEVPGVRAINETIDVGGQTPDFGTALRGRVGPFLVAVDPPAPAGFIGGGAASLQTVTGSPFGTNFLRVQGPGGIDVQTDQFMLSGKIFTGVVPSPLVVHRATYKRVNPADVDVFAVSAPAVSLSVSGAGLPAIPMLGDGAGKFFGHIHLANSTLLPPSVTVTASNPPNTPTSIIRNLVDFVTITMAEYDVSTGTLTIEANSGDAVTPPTLTATGFGDLVLGSLVVNNVVAPPFEVTVTSSAGGQDKRKVDVVVSGNLPPIAVNDTAQAAPGVPVVINLTANDIDMDGLINPGTVQIVTPPASGILVNNLNGTVTFTSAGGVVTFTYTVQDNLGATSNVATVTVTANSSPVAQNDNAFSVNGAPAVINVIANDTDVDGTINPASVVIVSPPLSGTAVNNLDGTVTYTPAVDFAGTVTFTYTVNDNLGAVSNIATVTVNVFPNEVITVTAAVFRNIDLRWQVSGTDNVPAAGNIVTIHLGPLSGPVIGTAPVLPALGGGGTWSFSQRNSTIIPQPGATISVESTNGASVLGVPVRIR